jgi:hypothetical protein
LSSYRYSLCLANKTLEFVLLGFRCLPTYVHCNDCRIIAFGSLRYIHKFERLLS